MGGRRGEGEGEREWIGEEEREDEKCKVRGK